MKLLRSEKEFGRAIGNYARLQGNKEFIEAMCTLLRGELHWDIRPKNIALTNGSQSAFFILFNILAGANPHRVFFFPFDRIGALLRHEVLAD